MLNNNYIPDFWINENVKRLDNINGEIDSHRLGLFIIQEGRTLQNNKEFQSARNKFEIKCQESKN